MPICPTCHRWITRSELRAPKGAGPEASRDRCPTDGTILSMMEPLPAGPPRPKQPFSLREAAATALIAPFIYLFMAGAFAPLVAIVIVAVACGLTWLTGHAVFAIVGGIAAALMLAGGWVLRHYEA